MSFFVDLYTIAQAMPCDIGYGWQVWLSWWHEFLAC